MSSEQSKAKARGIADGCMTVALSAIGGGAKRYEFIAGRIAKALDAARDAALEEAAARCDELSDYMGDLAWTKCRVANAARQIRALKTKGGSDE